ncbi:MAG: ABC transporter permease [Bacteroidota bacterium]
MLSFKIAWRNLWKNKGFTLINLGGLAIGFTASLLLLLYVANEWKYNEQYANAENIYEVKVNHLDNTGAIVSTGDFTPNALANTMEAEFPGIRNAAMITWPSPTLLVNGTQRLKVQNRFADPAILKILSYKFISGDAHSAFSKPNSIILTNNAAKRLFGNAPAINQVVKFMNFAALTVTGVIEDHAQNMDYQFESLVSLNENIGLFPKDAHWDSYSFYTLLTLTDGVNPDDFNSGIKNGIKSHSTNATGEPFIYPMLKSHLYNEFSNGVPSGGRIQQVKIFIGLAIGILLIACINFMNLATARAGKRAKEVGIKKTIGASRTSLVVQFLMESVIMVSVSMVIAVALTEISLPVFNNLLHTKISLGFLSKTDWIMVLLSVLFLGIIAGSYPAFYLSSFAPVETLKGIIKTSRTSVSLRQILVVLQFTFAVLIITGTIVIYNQLQLIKDRPIGYNSDHLVEMPIEGMMFQKYDVLKSRLIQSGVVTAMCKTTASISTKNSSVNGLGWEGMTPADKSTDFNQIFTSEDFATTTGVKMILGRDFSSKMASDSAGILLNKSAIKTMRLANPLGKQVSFGGMKRTILGVFEDLIWADPSKKEMPMIIAWSKLMPDVITMRLNPAEPTASAIAKINKIAKELNPVYPVELKFVNGLYQEKFERERILSVLANLFGGLSIFISCLGLLGLSAFSAELRTKEVGIRKVLGATHLSIIKLLSWDFVKMVLIAVAIGLPVSYAAMNAWLSGFDFKVEITALMLAGAAGTIIAVAYLTVSFQAVKAASADPIKAIKYE